MMPARDFPSTSFSQQGNLHSSPQARRSSGKHAMCFSRWPVESDCNQEEPNQIKQ